MGIKLEKDQGITNLRDVGDSMNIIRHMVEVPPLRPHPQSNLRNIQPMCESLASIKFIHVFEKRNKREYYRSNKAYVLPLGIMKLKVGWDELSTLMFITTLV